MKSMMFAPLLGTVGLAAFNAQATNSVEPSHPVVTTQVETPRKWINNDKWTGKDKNLHFLGGAVIAGTVTLATEKPLVGALTGCGVGVVKEIRDYNDPANHTASYKDAAVTCLGSALGAYTGHVFLYKTNEGYRLEYNKKF